ncbi:lipopolysaccharide biosynthesis protein [Pseudoxanthomonas sacheonensis]|uniref:UDP-N-acetylmuramyl pentapeptide phosphotransferase/UDP-N-acetylglucosamine-1-phosphate transferase n=1 Tax=Pseudoxanthomonas sacheonensis TaxID=443615 RepID=A0ABU1RPE0_9GAMM|nr:lipopolysaccharide biosynthesis protein [Pseudoxanthomonas sacheonensis]MDR6840641.1 UDP-N-acetylmuramyl pentapeptide phosphotransferase/UDP-N-acetylglucosamine-1-phosphate transferase [Pseudoxanthomonas sacheonensis]
MTALPAWMLLHLVLAATGTWLARRYALKKQLLDQPGERRSHVVATPRGGGIAIVVSVLLGIVWLALKDPSDALLLGCFATGLILVAGIGWVDDHRPIPAWPRLLVHAVAAFLLAWGVHSSSPGLLAPVVAFVLALVLVNIWNFMDGIDGLAASQAAIVALAMVLLLDGVWAWIAAGLVAALAGFLPFNFPKARIFLGDVGSGALGFLLAGLLVAAFRSDRVSWPLLLLPISAFLVDAGFTLGMRILRREPWWMPHVQHTYQKWAGRNVSHVGVTLAYAGFSLVAAMLVLIGIGWTDYGSASICLVWFLGAGFLWARMRRDISNE